MSQKRYNTYFYSFLIFVVFILILKADISLSISYKEALNVFVNNSILSIITNTSIYFLGQNDIALRSPFIFFYFFSVILMYKFTENYFRYEKDRLISILIFMFLPGVLGASLLVNSAIVVIYFLLLYIYIFEKYKKHSYLLLILYLFIDNSFSILYLALLFYSLKNRDKKLIFVSSILFILSITIYGFPTDGKPKGFFVDTFAIYATIFSPILFLYYIYSLYRAGIKKDFSLIWYISITAFLLSLIFSIRQRIYVEDFAPYLVVSIPLAVRTFLHSYRIRLTEFRKIYNILAVSIVLMLLLNTILTLVNKPLYLILENPTKHFAYKYHFIEELSKELKNRNINYISSDDKELILRLKFYKINEGEDFFISSKKFYNYDEKILIKYYGKEVYTLYIKKIK